MLGGGRGQAGQRQQHGSGSGSASAGRQWQRSCGAAQGGQRQRQRGGRPRLVAGRPRAASGDRRRLAAAPSRRAGEPGESISGPERQQRRLRPPLPVSKGAPGLMPPRGEEETEEEGMRDNCCAKRRRVRWCEGVS
ncbi:hypothetical protein Taro_020961 [Colocasia esculenta]|uniref:Uncharacterized protein n=1 Tax=Colocasia esculenta TaxID=4460 RepID=A0A843V6T2_COLES|nr:hypothetical protein [Colocasia esculenta]